MTEKKMITESEATEAKEVISRLKAKDKLKQSERIELAQAQIVAFEWMKQSGTKLDVSQRLDFNEAKKIVSDARAKERFEGIKKNLIKAKDSALLRNLKENGIDTENEVKRIIKLAKCAEAHGIKSAEEMESYMSQHQ